jgi:hypothetical protein
VYFWEGGVTAQNAGFDLTGDGAVFSSVPSNQATIQNVGNGWYRCTLSVNVSSGNPLYIIGVMPTSQTHYSANWAGDGGGILLWGATDEPGTFATSHIPSDTQFTSRASTATYFDESGILKTAPINGARHGYSSPYLHQSFNLVGASLGMRYDEIAPRSAVETGLIMETDAATNLEDYGIRSSSSTNSSVGSGTTFLETTETTAPDGSYTASKFTMTASNDRLDEQYVTFTDGQYYTLSLWVKGVANTAIRCALLSNTGANVEVTVRLTGEWQKVSVTKKFLTAEGGTTVRTHAIIIRGNPGDAITSTNGEACTYASYVYTWGIQVELGEIATSTIPTYGATATRAADVASSVAYTREEDVAYIDDIQNSDWYDGADSGATIYAEGRTVFDTGLTDECVFVDFHSGSSTDEIRLYHRASTSTINFINDGGSDVILNSGIHGGNNYHKMAGAMALNDFAFSVDGGTTLSDVSNGPSLDTLTTMGIGGGYTSAITLSGHIKKISYYPERLTNAELVALTENN